MPTTRQDRTKSRMNHFPKMEMGDFSKVGGLSNHLNTLRDTIIVPLVNQHIYAHFHLKLPRGVLFHGPPGTGKTLVAGALANEMRREGLGPVAFFHRKGADVLSKWVGKSEENLRNLFDSAQKQRPSIIFFDELDGLAPARANHMDHVQDNIVSTLLALMDGLDSVPGVIVIGATNRLDALDPALRRPGRFDRELYFPLPSTQARFDILSVHTLVWPRPPSKEFRLQLAETTAGFCGADLQALCADAVLHCIKRMSMDRISSLANVHQINVEEADFWVARQNYTPTTLKMRTHMRKLDPVIKPLLQRQLDAILMDVRMIWPHFLTQSYQYQIGCERYLGRLVLFGTHGVDTYIIPAILQQMEHLPQYVLEVPSMFQNDCTTFLKNLPSVVVLPQIDVFWTVIETVDKIAIVHILEGIHTGLPVMIIASFKEEVPDMLQNFFYNTSSIVKRVENPTDPEIGEFFAPLFFHDLSTALKGDTSKSILNKKSDHPTVSNTTDRSIHHVISGRIFKHRSNFLTHTKQKIKSISKIRTHNELDVSLDYELVPKPIFAHVLSNVCNRKKCSQTKSKTTMDRELRQQELQNLYGDSEDINKQLIYKLWERTVLLANRMELPKLEIIYDSLRASINIHRSNFDSVIENLISSLDYIENSHL